MVLKLIVFRKNISTGLMSSSIKRSKHVELAYKPDGTIGKFIFQ